ncbi:epidermal retinol dehydrogenase 2-like [Anneissia japonica]|uniref:epidermal retinol dehydrogenase 2-like n=1 Tax=Anneissia japonica TaxID=1529436 RepID=UPI001425B7F8|nr:epidermal retinol dehydrogenase 2-like [Anneissia japonica]
MAFFGRERVDEFYHHKRSNSKVFGPMPFFRLITFFIELFVLFQRIWLSVFRVIWRLFFSAPLKVVDGENVLVTGAASGLGRLLSLAFAQLGANMILIDIDENGLKETEKDAKYFGKKVHYYVCDLSQRSEIYKTVSEIQKDFAGGVDFIVNNAGIVSGTNFLDCSDEMLAKIFEVNTLAYIWITKAFLPNMLARNHGHIINVASTSGYIGSNGLIDYCTSKFATVGFSEAMQCELRKIRRTGVKVTVIAPSYFKSGMFAGCTSRFPRPLNLDSAVTTIMKGILRNEEVIFVPWYMQYMPLLKALLPVRALFAILDFIGTTNFMSGYKDKD